MPPGARKLLRIARITRLSECLFMSVRTCLELGFFGAVAVYLRDYCTAIALPFHGLFARWPMKSETRKEPLPSLRKQ